jgi:hypothetical protein
VARLLEAGARKEAREGRGCCEVLREARALAIYSRTGERIRMAVAMSWPEYWSTEATTLAGARCRGAADLTAFKAMRWLREEEAKERGDRSGSREEQRLRRRSPWRKERKSGGGSYGRGCTRLRGS